MVSFACKEDGSQVNTALQINLCSHFNKRSSLLLHMSCVHGFERPTGYIRFSLKRHLTSKLTAWSKSWHPNDKTSLLFIDTKFNYINF